MAEAVQDTCRSLSSQDTGQCPPSSCSVAITPARLEREFHPRRLCNWEVPWRRVQRPKARRTATRVIADDRGHLLPGIQRSSRPPWGSRLPVWDLHRVPRRRVKEVTESQQPHLTSWEKRSSHVPLTRPLDDEVAILRNGSLHQRSRCGNSAPGPRQTSAEKRCLTPNAGNGCKSLIPLQNTGQSSPPVEEQCKDGGSGPHSPKNTSSRKNTPPSPRPGDPPLADGYCAAQVAKRHAQDNLKHRPLPDIVDDATYKALESQRHVHPGLSLDVEPKAAAVGWRGYGAAGPTQCSKLRVYRPGTGRAPRTSAETPPPPPAGGSRRPSTGKPRLARQDNISEMQLAICWDVKPPPEQGEPRPSPHIDGSNGSAAPAVFTLVHRPGPEQGACGEPGGCSPQPQGKVFDNSFASRSSGSSGRARSHPKTAWIEKDNNNNENNNNKNNSAGNTSFDEHMKSNPMRNSRDRTCSANGRKHAGADHKSTSDNVNSPESSASLIRQKHHRSSPNLTMTGGDRHYIPGDVAYRDGKKPPNARPCIACKLKSAGGSVSAEGRRPRSDYKSAFKAGKPDNSSSSGLSSANGRRPQTSKVRVPKPRACLKRNYSIDTLAPPFSLWPGNTGQDYPEHWRLASVYQHAYKPIEARKKPLLASVYQ